ncbi:LysR family transcriptional regulator [Variovorax sp. 375MFSha3.1]|uniref:LysR family transcriptional regulator n=1 Tax=unclassified Variovorax TaxID=663243 RepID=UPI003AAF1472
MPLRTAVDPGLLPALAWFAVIARHRSFTKAAAEMGVTRAALSQNLQALERRLDARLLHRTTRDVSLTQEGQRLYDALLPALGGIDRAVHGLGESLAEPSGLLRVNSSRIAARCLIEPHLQEFLARHPKLQLELVMDDALSNIVADGCDAGIRLGESLAEHVVAVPISPMLSMAVVASPDYFARRGRPESPGDLVQHDCIRFRQTGSGAIFRWEFSDPSVAGHAFRFEPKGSYLTNDDEGMLRAALQGVGLIQHLDLAVQPHLAAGQLERVLAGWCMPFAGFYLYVPTRDQMPAKVRALMDFLVEKREAPAAPTKSREGRSKEKRS